MINRLIEVSLENRGVVLAAYAALAIWGAWALRSASVDAIPDLSDNQVIVFTDWPGHGAQEVEDQVTYPLTTSLQGLAGVRVVRAQSAFGFSMIYVVFEDATDLYFARARVLERMNLVTSRLPAGAVPALGPVRHGDVEGDDRASDYAGVIAMSLSTPLTPGTRRTALSAAARWCIQLTVPSSVM